eukprot:692943-Ditylum_brightwellii.AAC.1
MYMRLPHSIECTISGEEHVLKLLKNLWADYVKKGLNEIVIFCFYVDNGIFVVPDDDQINQAIKDLKELESDIEEQRDITDYLWVNFV